MALYLALLRGINVSGQKLIKMDALRALFEAQGCDNVKTYIQTGNVIFNHREEDADKMKQMIEAFIEKEYGFFVPTIIRSRDEMNAVLEANPYLARPDANVKQIYIAYLERTPTKEEVEALLTATNENEEAMVIGNEAWLFYRLGAGKAKLSNAVLERKMKIKATMRNWNTTNKLVALLSDRK